MRPLILASILCLASLNSPFAMADEASQTAAIDESFREQLAKCWRPPAKEFALALSVIISFNVDGSLAGPIEFSEQSKQLLNGDHVNKSAAAIVEAVERCAPFKLPANQYDYWKTVELNFDPREMTGQ